MCTRTYSAFLSVWVRSLSLALRRLTLHCHTQLWHLCLLLLLLVLPCALPKCNAIPGIATLRSGLQQGLLLVSHHRLAVFSHLYVLLLAVGIQPLSHAAPPAATAAANTTAAAAADKEEDNPVPVHVHCSHRLRASAASAAAHTFSEVVVIDDNDDEAL